MVSKYFFGQSESKTDNNRVMKRFEVQGLSTRIRKTGSFKWCAKQKMNLCDVRNIGRGGFNFSTEIKLSQGQSLDVDLITSKGEMLTTKGTIQHTKKEDTIDDDTLYSYCVSFSEINVELLRVIRNMSGRVQTVPSFA